MGKILSVHDQNLIRSSRLLVLLEMLHETFADAIIHVLYVQDRSSPDVFEPVHRNSFGRAIATVSLVAKYARVRLIICIVSKCKFWLPDKLLVPLQQSVLLLIFVYAGENGRFEAHLSI